MLESIPGLLKPFQIRTLHIPWSIQVPKPKFSNFLGPQASILWNRFVVINQFCCGFGIHSMWKNWRFQNCRCNMFCVGNGTLISHNIFNTQKLSCQLWDDKSIPALKFNIFMGHDRVDSILGSYSIQGSDFSPIACPHIPFPSRSHFVCKFSRHAANLSVLKPWSPIITVLVFPDFTNTYSRTTASYRLTQLFRPNTENSQFLGASKLPLLECKLFKEHRNRFPA
jgi:hypothetical protein